MVHGAVAMGEQVLRGQPATGVLVRSDEDLVLEIGEAPASEGEHGDVRVDAGGGPGISIGSESTIPSTPSPRRASIAACTSSRPVESVRWIDSE